MTEKILDNEKIEQKFPDINLDSFVDSQLDKWQQDNVAAAERVNAYPATYDEYRELPLTERLTAASGIYLAETPTIYRTSNKMPENPLVFNIASLTSRDIDYMNAQIAFAEGDYDDYRLPYLRIDIEHSKDNVSTLQRFAELSIDMNYHGGGYAKYRESNNRFYARKSGNLWSSQATADYDHPFFQDVIQIVDMGIENIYRNKIIHRIQKLGAAVLKEVQ